MIRFCFITDITKFSQLSIFSTINNLTNISMDSGELKVKLIIKGASYQKNTYLCSPIQTAVRNDGDISGLS